MDRVNQGIVGLHVEKKPWISDVLYDEATKMRLVFISRLRGLPKFSDDSRLIGFSASANHRTQSCILVVRLVVLAGAITVGCVGHGEDALQKKLADRTAKLDHIIDGLASRNKQPPIVDVAHKEPTPEGSVWNIVGTGRAPIFSKDYQWADQERVRGVVEELEKNHGAELWPRLVEHSKDMRYSMTFIDDEDPVNISVGKVCWWIAHSDLLYPYQQFSGTSVLFYEDYPERVYYPILIHPYDLDDEVAYDKGTRKGEDLRSWFRSRANKPLYKLQIEVCEWVTERVSKLEGVPEKPRAEFLAHVKEQIQILRRTQQPIIRRTKPSIAINGTRVRFFTKEWAQEIREGSGRIRKDQRDQN